MTDLILHIERLLPEHDCIVVPGLGGFVQNETCARLLHNKETFYPSGKEISFNSRLTFNDGVLVQSYQETFTLGFDEALEKVKSDVNEVNFYLDKGKFIRIGKIGVLHKSEDGKILFKPDNRNLFYPESYGLMPFVFPNLEHRSTPRLRRSSKRNEDSVIHIRLTKKHFQNFFTAVAASLLIMFVAKPAGDFEGPESQNAFLLQNIIMAQPDLSSKSTIVEDIADVERVAKVEETKTIPVPVKKTEPIKITDPVKKAEPVKKTELNKTSDLAKKVEPAISNNTNQKSYYIIISSFPDKQSAQDWLSKNKKGIYANAGIVEGDGRARIYVKEFKDKVQAEKILDNFRSDNARHSDAWIFSKKKN